MSATPDPSAYAALGRLAHALDLEVGPALESFCETFRGHLAHFTEVGVLLRPRALAVVTLGRGSVFGGRVSAWLREMGFDDGVAERIRDLQATVDDWMLLRLLTDGGSTYEVGLYFRHALPVDAALRWLDGRGVDPREQRAVRLLAELTGARQTGIVAARLRPGQPVAYKVYLHIRPGSAGHFGRTLGPVFERFEVAWPRWRELLARMDDMHDLRPEDVYASLTVGEGEAFESLKLDMFRVELESFSRVMRETGLLGPDDPCPVDLGRELSLHTAEHCGLRFHPDHCDLTFYFVPPRGDDP
ncbi:MAG: hypothetical protein ACQEXJ_04060 [Myxococcota bacterium]